MELYYVRSKWQTYIQDHSILFELSLAEAMKALCEELKNNKKDIQVLPLLAPT